MTGIPETGKRFRLRQELTPLVNRYVIHAVDEDGREAERVAVAQQKRFSIKEKITFFADEDRRTPLFSVTARTALDVAGQYDVFDEHGQAIGTLRKRGVASIVRSTWQVDHGGVTCLGKERNRTVAFLRRAVDLLPIDIPIPFVYHFDFTTEDRPTFSVEREWAMRDRYLVTITDPRLDPRVVLAQAVVLDALQGR